MPLYQDEGVVLRTAKLGEADRILTLLTRDHGKVRAVAKGVRRTKSRFGGRLEPFMRVALLIAEGRSLDVVSQAESIAAYAGPICADFQAYTAANVICETADNLVATEKEPAVAQYRLVLGALNALAKHAHEPSTIGDSYVLRALAIAGWTPRLRVCVVCGEPISSTLSWYFSIPAGGLMCAADHTPESEAVSWDAICRLSALVDGDWGGPGRCSGGRVDSTGNPPNSGRMGRILSGAADSFHALARLAGMAFENVDYKSLDIPAAPFSDPSIIPDFPKNKVPRHVGVIMDGNGRWAQQRGLIRTDGHQAAEPVVFDTIAGAIEAGVRYLSLYTFSTENWKRSPQEVRFLMGFSRDIIHRRVDQMNEWGVRVRWSGRRPKLWKSVIDELEVAQEKTKNNKTIDVVFCLNYGGRAEIADACAAIAREVRDGKISGDRVTEKMIAEHLYNPDIPDCDLVIRTSGEQRTSNFLPWEAAYAELDFVPELFPDCGREVLWRSIDHYIHRDRRFGGVKR